MGFHETSVLVIVVVAELLVAAFFVVSLWLDSKTLHSHYSFTPRSVASYTAWGTTADVLVPVLQMPLIGFSFFALESASRLKRFVPLLASAVAVALLVSCNVLGSRETSQRVALESDFAAKFNDFYCDTRTLRMCLQGTPEDVLVLTRGNASDVSATENVTDAGLAIWSRCNEVLLQSIALEAGLEGSDGDGDDDIKREGEIEVELNSFYKFVNDCDNSRALDAWCGAVQQRDAPLSDAEQRARPSAFAANPKFYRSYTREWTKRALFANALLGSAAGLLLVAAGIALSRPLDRR